MKGKPDIFGVWERSVIIGHLLFPKNNYWGIHCFRFYFLEHDCHFVLICMKTKRMANTECEPPRKCPVWLCCMARWREQGLGCLGCSWGLRLLVTGLAQFSLTLQGLVTGTTGVKTWCTRLWRDSGCSTPGPGSGPASPALVTGQVLCTVTPAPAAWCDRFYNSWRIFLYELYIVGFLEM